MRVGCIFCYFCLSTLPPPRNTYPTVHVYRPSSLHLFRFVVLTDHPLNLLRVRTWRYHGVSIWLVISFLRHELAPSSLFFPHQCTIYISEMLHSVRARVPHVWERYIDLSGISFVWFFLGSSGMPWFTPLPPYPPHTHTRTPLCTYVYSLFSLFLVWLHRLVHYKIVLDAASRLQGVSNRISYVFRCLFVCSLPTDILRWSGRHCLFFFATFHLLSSSSVVTRRRLQSSGRGANRAPSWCWVFPRCHLLLYL